MSFLFGRRSIRQYQTAPVSDEIVADLLAAAMAAPSACKKDPWRFVVVRDRDRLAAIAAVLPNGKMLTSAAVGIAVCGDLGAAHGGELGYLLQDCSAAIENLLLAAHALGLGACWLGVYPRRTRIEALTKILRLPDNVLPVSCVAVGWPAEKQPARTRFEPGHVHRETW
ncbi:MAG: nitroreductase family protein [Deltaproteobacteria bacterium]|nr:nitroreductase family protein [Deltaproteobacteria bacterium]